MELMTKSEVIDIAFERKIEANKFNTHIIEMVQEKHILPVLGEDFYDAIIDAPASYTAVIDLIKPALAYFVKYYLLASLYSEIGTLGIAKITGTNRITDDRANYEALRQSTLELAKMATQRLAKYLDDNSDTYPLYYMGSSPEERIVEAGGIIFRKRNPYTDDPFYTDDDDYTMYLTEY